MISFLTSLLARPFLQKLPLPDAAKGKISAINALLSGGSGDAWMALGRQQSTLSFHALQRATSATAAQGEVEHDGKPVQWRQFEWRSDARIGPCTIHNACWRFYATGLVCLELSASKGDEGLDPSDLVGHGIELRAGDGFLIGVWSAAFLLHTGAQRMTFQTSNVDDSLPLQLHFSGIASEQQGYSFLI